MSVLESRAVEDGGRLPATVRRVAPLLDLDPELGRALARERWPAARADVMVRVVRLRRGPWDVQAVRAVNGSHLGLLVLDGLLGRELLADDVASLELLGPGDVLRPWEDPDDDPLLRAVVRWTALVDTTLAVLDRRVAGALGPYPEIYGALLERVAARCRRLAVTQAISQLNRVDRRLLVLFWHLAERWGKVTPSGIAIPLTLSHRMLAQLVGARRPTVSSALADLAGAGELRRETNGTWLLTGAPAGTPDHRTARFIAPRRKLVDAAAG